MRYNSLNGLRALGAFSIVAVHVLKMTYQPPFTGAFQYISIGEWAVEMFFIVSAFAMCCGYYQKIKNNSISINDFYSKRYKRILPFWIIMLLLGLASKPSCDYLLQFVIEAPLTFNLCFYPNISLLSVGWFLGMVFTFYIIFPFFVFLIWTKKRAWLTLGASLILSLTSSHYYDTIEAAGPLHIVGLSIIVFSPRFVIGGLLYLYKDKIIKFFESMTSNLQICTRIGLLCLILISFHLMTLHSFIVNAFNVLFVLYAISFVRYPILDNKITKIISDLSMEIYLSHMFIFRTLEKFNCIHLIDNYTLNYLVVFCLVFSGAFIFSYITKILVIPIFFKIPYVLNTTNKIDS